MDTTAAAPTLDVSWLHLALSGALVLVAAGIASWQRLGLARGFLIGGVRAFVQLLAVGYVLVYLFETKRWWLVLLALAVMLLAATATATRRRGKAPAGERKR